MMMFEKEFSHGFGLVAQLLMVYNLRKILIKWNITKVNQYINVNSLKYSYFCIIVARNWGSDLTEHCRLNCTYSSHKLLKHIRTMLISVTL